MSVMLVRQGRAVVLELKSNSGIKLLILQLILGKGDGASSALLLSLFGPACRISCYNSTTMKNSAKKAIRESVAAPAPVRETGPRSHKFHVGQAVYFTAGTMGRPGASGSYKIVKLLPSEGDEHQYRIKSPGEAFERVAKESQLDRDR